MFHIFAARGTTNLHIQIVHTPTNNIIFHFVFFYFELSNIVMSSSILICVFFSLLKPTIAMYINESAATVNCRIKLIIGKKMMNTDALDERAQEK